MHNVLDEFGLQGRREHLDQLVRLLLVRDHQGHQLARAARLELDAVRRLFDLDRAGRLGVDEGNKLFDVGDLLGLWMWLVVSLCCWMRMVGSGSGWYPELPD